MHTNNYYGEFKPLDGFMASLTDTLLITDNYLNLSDADEARLVELLDGGYSYLVIQDGRVVEPILVTTYCGRLRVVRDAARKFSYRCGVCVKYKVTRLVVEDIVCQDFECEGRMPYTELPDFISNLTAPLNAVDTDLPIFDEHLARLLSVMPNGNFTDLVLQDGYKIELIRVNKQDGKIFIERGQGVTEPTTFPKGSSVSWVMTTDAVKSIVCGMPCCPDKEATPALTTGTLVN